MSPLWQRLAGKKTGKLAGQKEASVWVRGEDAAARHMKSNGYQIIDRNLRIGAIGEIDLLCIEPKTGTIVVVEVKARKRGADDSRTIDPEANITAAKKSKLRTLTTALTKRAEYHNRPIRIDVIAVVFEDRKRKPVEIRHYESAV